jgi:hypothetical protein
MLISRSQRLCDYFSAGAINTQYFPAAGAAGNDADTGETLSHIRAWCTLPSA